MALSRRGIPNKVVSIFTSTYNGAKYRVLHNGTVSEAFFVGSGVRQVCMLSPVLFLLVIGDIIQASIAKHHSVSKYAGIRCKMDSFLQHLDYVDNICLLSPSVLDAANMLFALENEAAYFELKINSG